MNKKVLKDRIIASLKDQKEIEKIIIFGSFNKSSEPNDLDIAVVQNSKEKKVSYDDIRKKYTKKSSLLQLLEIIK